MLRKLLEQSRLNPAIWQGMPLQLIQVHDILIDDLTQSASRVRHHGLLVFRMEVLFTCMQGIP